MWGDDDIICNLEDAYFELSDYMATKHLDGHDMYDQWLMKVHTKFSELLDALSEGNEKGVAPDVLNDHIKEIM